MLYKSVANISQNIDNIPSYLKDDIIAILQQYLEFFRQYPAIARVYLAGSALTEECRDKSDLDFLIVIKEWEQYCASPKQSSAFYWNVLNKGVLIYESH